MQCANISKCEITPVVKKIQSQFVLSLQLKGTFLHSFPGTSKTGNVYCLKNNNHQCKKFTPLEFEFQFFWWTPNPTKNRWLTMILSDNFCGHVIMMNSLHLPFMLSKCISRTHSVVRSIMRDQFVVFFLFSASIAKLAALDFDFLLPSSTVRCTHISNQFKFNWSAHDGALNYTTV